METNKKRSCKTSAQQFNIYITFLEQNPKFAQNKMCASQPRYLEHKWEELRVLLNSCGNGAVHDVQGWKKDMMTQIIGNCTADMGEIEGEVVESNVDETLPKSTPRRSLKRKRCTTDTQKEKKRYASDVATAYAAESRAQIEVFGNIAGSIKSVSVAICEVAKIQADVAEAHADLTKSHTESIHELSNSISKLADAHLKSADAKLKLAEAKLHKYNTNNK